MKQLRFRCSNIGSIFLRVYFPLLLSLLIFTLEHNGCDCIHSFLFTLQFDKDTRRVAGDCHPIITMNVSSTGPTDVTCIRPVANLLMLYFFLPPESWAGGQEDELTCQAALGY